MKNRSFKIRTVAAPNKDQTISDRGQSKILPGQKKDGIFQKPNMEDLLIQMHEMLQDSKNKGLRISQLEARDRFIQISTGQYNSDEIQAWMGEVCREVMSSAFNYYLNGQMNYDQTKLYCCQGILKNISQFVQNNRQEINPQFYSTVDKILTSKVLPYLGLKYPPSVSNEVNKKLNKVFKEINNMEVITNDFFYNTDIAFEYRENGIYNDLIMQVINQIIKMPDSSISMDEESESKTNFEDFQEFMSDLFEKVYDQEWMIKGKKKKGEAAEAGGEKQESQRQKYRQAVKEYTHYLIGRKIPENVQQFDQFQIKSGFINIKSPTILRIFTKWCEQLWNKFQNQNYYIDRTEGMTMLKGKQVNIVPPWLKRDLKINIEAEKKNILQYMKKVELNNYEQQHLIMECQHLSKQAPFMDKHERICGKFSLKIVKNLQNYIVVYLNRLIHGLMTVSKLVYKKLSLTPSWPYPPNLLSFKVGDLLRCKCASKEKQIQRIFQQLQQISEKNPQKLKIIRIKNRLKLGTNDILINIRFNNCLTGQIQLKVQSKSQNHSQSSLCSYNFSHLIYQIQRSYFGPITEMCSIWSNIDPQKKILRKLITEQSPNDENSQPKDSQCVINIKDHNLVISDSNPFICSQCGKAYSNNNYIIPHYSCTECKYWKCALCSIIEKEDTNLIEMAIEDEQVIANCKPVRCKQLPTYFVGLFVESKLKEVTYYKVVQQLQKKYLFKIINNQSFELFKQLSTQNAVKSFIQEHLIFELKPSFIDKLPQIDNKTIIKQQILPAYVSKCYKFKKQTLSLNCLKEFGITRDDFSKMLKGNKQLKKYVKFIEISMNEVYTPNFITHDFKNLQLLNINENNVQEITHLSGFNKLQTLVAISNQISEFPSEMCSMKLKSISLSYNNIHKLPNKFSHLKYLQILKIENNQLTTFPQSFGQLQSLKELHADVNKIYNIENLKCPLLEYVSLSQNQLASLSRKIQALTNLTYLNVKWNKIKIIQTQFSKLKKLKDLLISSNPLTEMPPKIYQASQLINLDISMSSFSKLNLNGGNFKQLKNINLENSRVTEIMGIKNLKGIEQINLSSNMFKVLPQDIFYLSHAKIINLTSNYLTQLPPRFGQLRKLKILLLNFNQLYAFPPSFFTLKLQILNFSNNRFYGLPNQLMQMKSLKKLQFQNNVIDQLPWSISSLINLEVLNFNNNKITSIPVEINKLKKLKELKYNGLCLTDLPAILLKFNHDFMKNGIKTLPQTLPQLQNIEILNFNENQIAKIPQSFGTITSIKYLYLSGNKLTQICQPIFNLDNLVYLELGSNQIELIPDKFDALPKLKTLQLSNNQIKLIPDNFYNLLKNGLNFTFFNNPLTSIQDWVLTYSKQLNNGKRLCLSGYKLSKLPNLPNAQQFKEIILNNNSFVTLPQQIYQCFTLQSLDLSNNLVENIYDSNTQDQKINRNGDNNINALINADADFNIALSMNSAIKTIVNTIFNLASLQNLNLSNNKIKEIPQSFKKFTKLAHLDISKNPIKRLPTAFKQIHLKSLTIDLGCFEDLSGTKSLQWIHTDLLLFADQNIQQLPQSFVEIGFLSQFSILSQSLSKLPLSFVNIKTLTKIRIEKCTKFQQLPQDIGKLQNLQEVVIINCPISKIPQSFYKLSKLKKMEISSTLINSLSDKIGDLINLKEFIINQNKITKLPNSIGQLQKMQVLSIRQNKISQLPMGIWKCQYLKRIYAQNNAIRVISRELEELKQIEKGQLCFDKNPIEDVDCVQFTIERGNEATRKIAMEFKEKRKKTHEKRPGEKTKRQSFY